MKVPIKVQNRLTLRFISLAALLIILIITAVRYQLMAMVHSLTGVRVSYFDIDRFSAVSLLDLLETPSDSRVRLAKLKGTSVLGRISMWVAFPATDAVVPGASWYDPIWNSYDLPAFKNADDIMSLSPCNGHDKVFIQIGAHLGIFPLVAAYRGCQGIAVEPMPAASNFSRITAMINNWGSERFLAINAIGSDTDGGNMWFDPSTISISTSETDLSRKIRVPVTTLDVLNDKYGMTSTDGQSRFAFVIIDVEGHEQTVLMGAKRLIEKRSVLAFEIEVWTKQASKGLITYFPGLQLLIDNGYRLYTTAANAGMPFNSCDEITNRIADLPRIFNQSCVSAKLPDTTCLGEVFAIRNDLPAFRQWFSACPK